LDFVILQILKRGFEVFMPPSAIQARERDGETNLAKQGVAISPSFRLKSFLIRHFSPEKGLILLLMSSIKFFVFLDGKDLPSPL
jgi:hypothetical protein